eukprot:5372145-Amphidinium_carterae.1
MQAGFIEWQGFPAAFLCFDGDALCGCLVLHVDDGIWAGKGKAWQTCQQKVRDLINEHTSMKESQGESELLVLGRRIHVAEGEVTIDCDDYIKALKPIFVPRERRLQSTDPLTPSEKTSYMSLVAQLAWPSRVCMPTLSYLVSRLQQDTARANVGHLLHVNAVARKARQMVTDGVCLHFCRFNCGLDDMRLAVVHDASFAGEEDYKSQKGYLGMICVPNGDVWKAALLEWDSSTIKRVVRSTLAAEASSASQSYDKLVFLKFAWSRLQGSEKHWREVNDQSVGHLITDCQSLHDHVNTSTGSVQEKRIARDLLDLRAAVELGSDEMHWQSTHLMPADGLTKHLTHQPPLVSLMGGLGYRFR